MRAFLLSCPVNIAWLCMYFFSLAWDLPGLLKFLRTSIPATSLLKLEYVCHCLSYRVRRDAVIEQHHSTETLGAAFSMVLHVLFRCAVFLFLFRLKCFVNIPVFVVSLQRCVLSICIPIPSSLQLSNTFAVISVFSYYELYTFAFFVQNDSFYSLNLSFFYIHVW